MNADPVPDTSLDIATSRSLAREMRSALTMVIVLALLSGIIFPLAVVGLGQLIFPAQAGGSLLRDAQGQIIGSKLIGQSFTDPKYFHPRPSAAGTDGYDARSSSGLNLGPTNQQFAETISERAQVYRTENGLTSDSLLPADAVTTSASGLDPHISPANAYVQVSRVAGARRLPEAEVRELVDKHLERRTLGVLGEPRVNVLLLNLALDGRLP